MAARPELALVIFDSTAAPGDAAAVYVEGRGEELEGHELEHAIAVYSRRSEATGLAAWSAADVTAPALRPSTGTFNHTTEGRSPGCEDNTALRQVAKITSGG